MNWKRVIGVSAGVIGAIAVIFCVKECRDNRVTEQVQDARNTINEAITQIDAVRKQNDSLRNETAKWQDSVDFYKKNLADCEKSKQKTQHKPVNDKPGRVNKPAVEKDTVWIVKETVRGNGSDNTHTTTIRMEQNTRNNENIVVQNEKEAGSDTEIVLGQGAVNDGNIIVNNGGHVHIDGNKQAVDSLRVVVDSLKQGASKTFAASASSVVVVKKVQTYKRTR